MAKRKSALFTRVKKRISTGTPRSSQLTPSSLNHHTPPRRQYDQASSPALEALSPEDSPDQQRRRLPAKSHARSQPRSQLAGRKRKRQSPSPSVSDSGADELSHVRFPLLKPRERYVKQTVVKDRWDPLPEAAQEKVRQIFQTIERPLVAVQRDEKQRVEGQTVLAQVLRTLERRLPRMPFPPGTREGNFDYEGLLRGNRTLEQQLIPARHSVAILKGEIRKERDRLAIDKRDLEELRKNAKSEDKVLRRTVAKSHRLLDQTPDEGCEDRPEDIALVEGSLIEDLPDDEELDHSLQPLTLQIRGHLESMDNNSAQVEGIAVQLLASASALDSTLYRRLPAGSYSKLPSL